MFKRRVRVRFAPSPTGPLHIGGVRTALYNYLFAKKNNGDFILRIEDTDQTRFVPGAEEYIVETLKWCGIEPNEGVGFGEGEHKPYRQSERKSIYRQYAEQLVENGFAYYAFDTEQDLETARKHAKLADGSFSYNAITRQNMKNSLSLSQDEVEKKISSGEDYVIRIKIPRNEKIRLQDLIRGWVVVHTSQMDDKVLLKADGMPTYHLANVVDDYLFKITHVIRGEEWLPSTPLHVLLYKYLGWEKEMPQFAHLPLLLRPDGNGKLSKRDGDRLGFPVFPLNWTDPQTKETFSGYREKGYFPDAFVNMLALLGWHASSNQEIFSLQELVNEFSLEKVSRHGARFDPEKARWFNQQYLRKKSNEEIAKMFLETFRHKPEVSSRNPEYIKKVCSLLQEKACFVNEFWGMGSYFFTEPENYQIDEVKNKFAVNSRKQWIGGYEEPELTEMKWKEFVRGFFDGLIEKFSGIDNFNLKTIEETFKSYTKIFKWNLSHGQLTMLLRISLCGTKSGPALFETASLLGKEETIKRLNSFVKQYG